MKYLSSEPFTVAVTNYQRKKVREWCENDGKRDEPHEYVNNGAMCLVCGLGKEAKIHDVVIQRFQGIDVAYE